MATSEHGELPYTQGVDSFNLVLTNPNFPAMHQILFLQSVCRLLRLFPPPTSRPEPRGEQAQRRKSLQPDLIRWLGVITLKCLKTHMT